MYEIRKGRKEMTNTKNRRFVALLLTLVMMVLSCSVSLFAFAEDEVEATTTVTAEKTLKDLGIKYYVHFGDSMSTGYMMNATQEDLQSFNPSISLDGMQFPTDNPRTATHNNKNPYTKGSYPSLLAEALGLDSKHWYSFAREGLCTNDIHRIIDPGYYNYMDDQAKRNSDTAFSTLFGTAEQGQEEYNGMVKKAAKLLPKADLVTFGMGPNDIIFSPIFDMMYVLKNAVSGNSLYSGVVQQAEDLANAYLAQGNAAGAYNAYFDAAKIVGALPELLATASLSIVRGYMAIQQNWEACVNYVRSVNPNCTIVCVGGYNATRDLQFMSMDFYRIGRNMGFATSIMNVYWNNTCPLRDQYLFVDIRNVDLPTWPYMMDWPGMLMNGGFMGYFMYCSHPSKLGHQQIANAIGDALLGKPGTNTLPVTSLL